MPTISTDRGGGVRLSCSEAHIFFSILSPSRDINKLLIFQNLSNDTNTAKEDIHREAEEKLGGHYAVICSTGHFDYIADSRHYCQQGNEHITCYAFQI